MQITRAAVERHHPNRVAIWVDDQFVCGCDVLVWLESGWHVGDTIVTQDLDLLRHNEALHTLQERALRLLAVRPRGRTELARRLAQPAKSQPAPDPEQIQTLLDKLAGEGLIDDQAFATFWVEQRDRFRPKSSQALRSELRTRGVGRDEIDAAITPEMDLERALQAGQRKAEQLVAMAAITPKIFHERLAPFLLRRGFSYAIVRSAVARLWRECAHDHTNEEAIEPDSE